jgi:predicted PurR-regulated permease PerM
MHHRYNQGAHILCAQSRPAYNNWRHLMSTATEVFLAIYLVLWSILGIGLVIAIFYLIAKIKALARHIDERVTPITNQVQDTVGKVSDAVGKVTHAAETIANQAEEVAHTARTTADHVAGRIETAVDVLRDTVVAPAIGINSVLTGARKAVETLRERWTHRGEAAKGESARDKD